MTIMSSTDTGRQNRWPSVRRMWFSHTLSLRAIDNTTRYILPLSSFYLKQNWGLAMLDRVWIKVVWWVAGGTELQLRCVCWRSASQFWVSRENVFSPCARGRKSQPQSWSVLQLEENRTRRSQTEGKKSPAALWKSLFCRDNHSVTSLAGSLQPEKALHIRRCFFPP